MSEPAVEQQQQNNGHPAWQEYLEGIPEDLQPVVSRAFETWDKQVQDKLAQARQPYEPYQDLIDQGVPPEYLQQALWVTQQLEKDPETLVKTAIENFNLKFVHEDDLEDDEDEDELEFDPDDPSTFENHPALKAVFEKAQQAEEYINQQKEAEQNAALEAELDEYLAELHKDPDYGNFDDMYVTALMAQGISGEDAVAQYHATIQLELERLGLTPEQLAAMQQQGQLQQPQQQQVQQQQTPVVMGAAGNAGSGLPNETPRMGELKNGDINDLVQQYLAQNAGS